MSDIDSTSYDDDGNTLHNVCDNTEVVVESLSMLAKTKSYLNGLKAIKS